MLKTMIMMVQESPPRCQSPSQIRDILDSMVDDAISTAEERGVVDDEEDFDPARLDDILARIRARTDPTAMYIDCSDTSSLVTTVEDDLSVSHTDEKKVVPEICVGSCSDDEVTGQAAGSVANRPRSPVTVQEWVESLPFPPPPMPTLPPQRQLLSTAGGGGMFRSSRRRNSRVPKAMTRDDIG